MNSTAHLNPLAASGTAAGHVTIMVHTGLPPIYERMLDIHRPAQFLILLRGLEFALRGAGLLAQEGIGGCGGLAEGIILFDTADRNKAIALVQDYLAACALLGRFIEIAWRDEAEGILRTCWPVGPTAPFERHLSAEAVQQRELIFQSAHLALNPEA